MKAAIFLEKSVLKPFQQQRRIIHLFQERMFAENEIPIQYTCTSKMGEGGGGTNEMVNMFLSSRYRWTMQTCGCCYFQGSRSVKARPM